MNIDEPTAFAITLMVGGAVAVLVAKWLLPRIGDGVATFIYSSNEQGSTGNSDATLAKLAKGDFTGAIRDFEKRLEENPKDLHAIRELTKIRAENLEDVDGALRELRARLSEAHWTLDERAFLRLRIADTLERAERYEAAIAELQSIVVDFPKTRHSANARHRLSTLQKR
jgi:tetratricopeptide (TPR) repeat protein